MLIGALVPAVVAARHAQEYVVELLSRVFVERFEERVLDALHEPAQLDQLTLAARRQRHHMAPAIIWVAAPFDEATVLEVVELSDELAAVEPEHVGDPRLCLRRTLAEEGEHSVLVAREARTLELGHHAQLDRDPDPRQQERRAGNQFLRQTQR